MTTPAPNDPLNLDPDPATDEPGFDLDAEGNVGVAGLKLPPALAVQVVEAMRALYPSVTGTLNDVQAVRAVLKYWVTVTLSTYAAQKATDTVVEQVVQLQAQAEEASKKARTKAEKAAELIVDPDLPTPAPPAEEPAPVDPPAEEPSPAA